MPNQPRQSEAPWADLLKEDVPVIDMDGKRLLVRGSAFVEIATPAAPVAPSGKPPLKAPAATRVAPPPPNLPVAPLEDMLPEKPSAPHLTLGDLNLGGTADDADIAKAAKSVEAKAIDAPAEKKEVMEMEDAVRRAVAESGVPLADADMKRRFELLASLFFRDLRDALETKSKFTMPVVSGGMGMSDADAERVTALLKARREDYRNAHAGVAAGAKASYVAERTELVLGRQVRIDRREDEKRDEAFNGLVQRVGVPIPAAPVPQPPNLPISQPPRAIPVTGTAPSAAVPITAKAEPPRSASGAVSSPSPVLAESGRPVVADVAPAPRLTGPVEEIRSLNLTDFRRLSRDPGEATLKVRDKIDLLADKSFDTKTQGIRAWQESGVNKLYLDVLRESLEGKPVADIIAAREKAGIPVPTKQEFDAIMALNRNLRFG